MSDLASSSSEIQSRSAPLILKCFEHVLLILSLIALVFCPTYLALNRFISPDEGFYAIAAKLVADQGMLPYRDFFYPQSLLFPYIYGAWMQLFGFTWNGARLLSALFTIGTGILLYFYLRRKFSKSLAAFGVLLFASSVLVLQWAPIVKASASALFFLFASFFIITAAPISGAFYVFAGILCSLSIQMRLPMAAAAPAMALWLLLQGCNLRSLSFNWRPFLLFTLGGFLGALPSLIVFALYPDEFLFNNLGYHLDRTIMSPKALARNKRVVFGVLTGLHPSDRHESIQFPMLFYSAALVLLTRIFKRRSVDPAAALGFLLFVTHLLPSPAYVQYFVVIVPLFIPALIQILSWLIESFSSFRPILQATATSFAVGITAIIWAFHIQVDIADALYTGQGMGIPQHDAQSWRIKKINAVAKALDQLTTPGEIVFAKWPGYLLEAHALPMPGTENQFSLQYTESKRVSDDLINRFKLSSNARVLNALESRQASLALIYGARRQDADLEKEFKARGYERLSKVSSVHIYRPIRVGSSVGSVETPQSQ